MAKLKVSEAQVKKSIVNYLTLQEKMGKCYFVRNNSFAGKLIGANGSQHYVQQGKKGSPDILICVPFRSAQFRIGRFIGIEVKSSIGEQSPEQKDAQRQIEALGGLYILARGIEDITHLF